MQCGGCLAAVLDFYKPAAKGQENAKNEFLASGVTLRQLIDWEAGEVTKEPKQHTCNVYDA